MIMVSASLQAANQTAAGLEVISTNSSLLFTTPPQVIPNQGAIKQLPSQVITALVNQQAFTNASLSDAQKRANGILPGTVGATFQQLSAPGQVIKPGAGEFIKSLQQSSPALNIAQSASKVLMTGTNGITNTAQLLSSTTSQTGAVVSSIQNATTGLVKAGTISTGSLQQSAGVIFAASTVGVGVVAAALKNPGSVSGAITGVTSTIQNSSIGQLVSGGNLAAGLADKVSSGVAGLANSVSGVVNGAIGGLSKGITDLVGKAKGGIQGGINSLIDSLASTAQNAFNVAEASFGSLTAGVPNSLGKPSAGQSSTNDLLALAKKSNAALESLLQAQTNFREAINAYNENPTEENLQRKQESRQRYEQKIAAVRQIHEEMGTIPSPSSQFGSTGAQGATVIATSVASGQLNKPNSTNTGLNALPGGNSLFANNVSANGKGLLNTVQSTVTAGIGATTGAFATLSNPSQLAGNLVGNLKATVTSGINGASQAISGALGGASVIGAQLDSLKTKALSLESGLLSSLDSIGEGPRIKIPTLVTGTFAIGKKITAKIGECLGDNRIPPPVFEEPPAEDIDVDEYLQEQTAIQTKIADYKFDRDLLTYRLDGAIQEYNTTGDPEILETINDWNNQLDVLDVLISQAQDQYDRLVTYT